MAAVAAQSPTWKWLKQILHSIPYVDTIVDREIVVVASPLLSSVERLLEQLSFPLTLLPHPSTRVALPPQFSASRPDRLTPQLNAPVSLSVHILEDSDRRDGDGGGDS